MDIHSKLSDLVASGQTQGEIARTAGCAQSTISMLLGRKRGVRPSAQLVDGINKAYRQMLRAKRKAA